MGLLRRTREPPRLGFLLPVGIAFLGGDAHPLGEGLPVIRVELSRETKG